jgi:hypothetical protein
MKEKEHDYRFECCGVDGRCIHVQVTYYDPHPEAGWVWKDWFPDHPQVSNVALTMKRPCIPCEYRACRHVQA